MNLSQLRYAKAVYETNSFSKAAEACFVTQPTLSNAISQLETELGGQLFLRTTRKVEVTEFGEFMSFLIENVLTAAANVEKQAKAFLNTEEQMIRLGVSPLINSDLLATIIESFRKTDAGVSFVLTESNLTNLFVQLDEKKLDFIFSPASPLYENQRRVSFYAEELLYVEKSDSIATGLEISLHDVADKTFVMVPNECGLADATRGIFGRDGFKLNEYSGKALSYQVLENWANIGVGSAILPKSKCSRQNTVAKTLVDDSGKPFLINYEMRWSSASQAKPVHRNFIEHFKTLVPTIVSGLHSY